MFQQLASQLLPEDGKEEAAMGSTDRRDSKGGCDLTMGKPWEHHGKTMGKWWFFMGFDGI